MLKGAARVKALVASLVSEYIPIYVLLYLFFNIPKALNAPLTRPHKYSTFSYKKISTGEIIMSDETFEKGVENATADFLFFIDPDDIDKENIHSASNIQVIRDALNVNSNNLGQLISDDEAKILLTDTLTVGGAAARGLDIAGIAVNPNATEDSIAHICLVVEPESNRTPQKYIQELTGLPSSRFKVTPSLDVIDEAVGTHEGTHCDIPNNQQNQLLGNEVRGDAAAITMLGQDPFAQMFTDYRTIATAHKIDPVHATGVALENGGVSDVTLDYVRATRAVKPSIDALFLEKGGYYNTNKMIRLNPERYVRTIETALRNNEFDDPNNPDLTEHVRAYTEAFRRQIKGVSPLIETAQNVNSSTMGTKTAFADLNDIKGSAANVDLTGDGRASMTIGEVSAPEFFASVANPNLAAERIAIQEITIENASITQEQISAVAIKA